MGIIWRRSSVLCLPPKPVPKRLSRKRRDWLTAAFGADHALGRQGLNLGFRDVACLRRVLRDARGRGSDIGAADVLRRYERERRSENALAAYGLDGIERLFGNGNAIVPGLRGAGLAIVDRPDPLKQFFAGLAAGRN